MTLTWTVVAAVLLGALLHASWNAVTIALYTVIDAIGVRTSGNPLQYVMALFALSGWPFALLVFARRGRNVAWPYARARWPFAMGGVNPRRAVSTAVILAGVVALRMG